MKNIVMIHDLPSGEVGKTIKELNLEKVHNYPVGSLVEYSETGIRLFIVNHSRDCDGTPLYNLCDDKNDTVQHKAGFFNSNWNNGYSEESLELIK